MKKKVLTLLIVMTLVFAYAVPVAATESEAAPAPAAMAEEVTPNDAPAASEDAQVQATYDAFEEMAAAYDSGDYAAMKAARETFWASQEEFTEAQTAEWENIIENTIGQDRYDTVTIDAGWLVDYFEPAYNAFSAEKNVHNAYDYVNAYEHMDWVDIDKFFADASTLYAEAKPMSPTSENVIKVYEVYDDMMFWFKDENGGSDSMFFEDAFKEFEALMDVYNEFTEDEMNQLAGLMGVADGEEAYNKILSDWILVNVAVELDALADAFNDSYSADDAKAFIEYYDSIVDSGMFTEEELELLIYRNYYDSVYEEAEYAIEQAANQDAAENDATTEGSDKSYKDSSPATGDDFNAAPYTVLMLVAAAVAALTVRRKKVQ